jgi:hypothetical protein
MKKRTAVCLLAPGAAETQAMLQQMGRQIRKAGKNAEEFEQRIKDLEAGKLDPPAYLKQCSKYVTAPPTAVYKPKLSRLASLNEYGNPIRERGGYLQGTLRAKRART